MHNWMLWWWIMRYFQKIKYYPHMGAFTSQWELEAAGVLEGGAGSLFAINYSPENKWNTTTNKSTAPAEGQISCYGGPCLKEGGRVGRRECVFLFEAASRLWICYSPPSSWNKQDHRPHNSTAKQVARNKNREVTSREQRQHECDPHTPRQSNT